jgi:ubiquitin C-terminal hydrolase
MLLLAALSWASREEDVSLAITPTVNKIKVGIEIDAIFPFNRLPENATRKYMLKALVCFYGHYYVAYVMMKADGWMRHDEKQSHRLSAFQDVKENMISGHQQPAFLLYQQVCQI